MDLLGHYLQDRQQKIRKTTDGIRSEIYEQLDCGEEISDEDQAETGYTACA